MREPTVLDIREFIARKSHLLALEHGFSETHELGDDADYGESTALGRWRELKELEWLLNNPKYLLTN